MALRSLSLAFLTVAALSGCAGQVVYGTPPPPPPPPPYYYPPPPPPIYEAVPPPPFFGAIWVGGYYYHWHGNWRWHHGYYRH